MADATSRPEHPGLRVIAVVKLLKAVLLLAVAFGSFRLLDRNLADAAREWARRLSIDPENRLLHLVLVKVSTLSPGRLRGIGAWSLIFAADQIAEGIGLWFNQAWAKYLLLAVTPFFFVYESGRLIWEAIHRKITPFHVFSVPITAAVLAYLIWIVRADFKRARAVPSA